MKISALETVRLETFPNLLYVRVHTDEGLIGLGETFYGAESVEAWIHATAAPVLLGKDPWRIEAHWQDLGTAIGSRSTGVENRGRSAIDIALWDLLGKSTNLPIYQLLGGACRDRIPVYNTCAGSSYVRVPPEAGNRSANWGLQEAKGSYQDLEAFLTRADELAEELLAEGYFGMKIWPFDLYADQYRGHYIAPEDLKKGLRPFEKIRKAVGDRIDIYVEMHSLWDLPTAIQIAGMVEEFRPLWFEDPIRMDNVSAIETFARSTRVPVAASETLGTRWAFRELFEKRAVGVVMFDPTWTGGFSEGKKIVAIAESYGLPIAPHDCLGPIGFAASVHLSTHAPNARVQEVVRAYFSGWYRDLVTNVPIVNQGYVTPLSGPGLGTDLLPDVLMRSDVRRRMTRLQHSKGSSKGAE